MADIASAPQSEDKQALPQGVKVSNMEPIPVGEHEAFKQSAKDFIRHYGETDYDAFRMKLGSNSILASRVFDDLMAEKFGGEKSSPTPFAEAGSPQEHNITGRLDHTGDVATRIKTGPASELPPVVNAK